VAKEKTLIEIKNRRFYIKPSKIKYEEERKAKYAAKMQAEEDRLWRS
jgi:ribosomal protein S21